MISLPLSAQHSVQTARFARHSPFRKGSVRHKAFEFLRTPRTLESFNRWARRVGVNPQNLLRTLRKLTELKEVDGTLRME